MKKILVTGANSYIGTALINWLSQWPRQYRTYELDLLDGNWRNHDFSQYDVIYHVAGIAHIKQTDENKDLYYEINRDLAVEVVKKSKLAGVKQFIFLSSMSIYGIEAGIIKKDTIPKPRCHYGKAKYEAEKVILALEDIDFSITILRPPMVYGRGCKGNFVKLNKLTNNIIFFPKISNKRSMIHIDNLNEFVKIIIDNKIKGVYCPQNAELVCTSEMVKLLSNKKNRNLYLVPGFNNIISFLATKFSVFMKVFGDLIYDEELSSIDYPYHIVDFEDSIQRSI